MRIFINKETKEIDYDVDGKTYGCFMVGQPSRFKAHPIDEAEVCGLFETPPTEGRVEVTPEEVKEFQEVLNETIH